MTSLRISAVLVSVLALGLAGPGLKAHGDNGKHDKTPGNITVAFGTGLNNSQAGIHTESSHPAAGVQGSHHQGEETGWDGGRRPGDGDLYHRRLPLAVGVPAGCHVAGGRGQRARRGTVRRL